MLDNYTTEISRLYGLYPADTDYNYSALERLVEESAIKAVEDVIEPYKDKIAKQSFDMERGGKSPIYRKIIENPDIEGKHLQLNCLRYCNSFMEVKGTKYEKYLRPEHLVINYKDKHFSIKYKELDVAEYHQDEDWFVYERRDRKAFERICKCYHEASQDGNQNATWCLACTNHAFSNTINAELIYYLTKMISEGHIASISSLSHLMAFYEENSLAFYLAYIGSMKNDIFSLWNMAIYYMYGTYVEKSLATAVKLLKKLLRVYYNKDFIKKNYGVDNPDVADLITLVHIHLKDWENDPEYWESAYNKDSKGWCEFRIYKKAKE